VRTDLISNSKIVERGKIDTPTHKYMTAQFNLKSIIHLYIRYIPVNTKSTSYGGLKSGLIRWMTLSDMVASNLAL
jgi:hypothetical protein